MDSPRPVDSFGIIFLSLSPQRGLGFSISGGVMKEIPLTQGKFALVDDEDFEELNRFKWNARKCQYTSYAYRSIHCDGKWTSEQMHRRILNVKSKEFVDHKNHNGLDNQKRNLRKCTRSQNQGNRNKNRGGSSRFKGVCWDKTNSKWLATIARRGFCKSLGRFSSEQDAARAYDIAANKYFGEFAHLNFPDQYIQGEKK